MQLSGASLRAWLRTRRPRGAPAIVAAVFVVAGLAIGGTGAVLALVAPPADGERIVDPIAAPVEAPLAGTDPLPGVEAGEPATVTSSWTPPVSSRGGGGSGGGGSGGGGGSAVLTHSNTARAAHGLPALAWNGTLAARSCAWAQQLAASDAGLAHSTNGGGFAWWGENVASGYPSAAAVVAGWMGSPPHRENILRAAFTAMGSCSATAESGTVYWVQQFGG